MWGVEPVQAIVLVLSALAASAIAAIVGFGGAILLLPALVWTFGVRDAVPILTVVQLVGNGSRVWFNRRAIDRPVVGWYSLGAVPVALIGGLAFAAAPAPWLARGVGLFLVAVVAYRRAGQGRHTRCPLRAFAGVGAVSSLLSSMVGSTGPVTAPFFLAYGLSRGAYIGTEAAATVVTHVFKLIAYGWSGLITPRVLAASLPLVPFMIMGSWAGKRLVDRLSVRAFVVLIEVVVLAAGAMLLIRA